MPSGMRLAMLFCAGGLVVASAGGSVAEPEHRMVADPDGSYLHVAFYRPVAQRSGVVLLIHDWGSSGAQCCDPLARAMAEAGFAVIVPDLPGHGRSLIPELLQPVPSVPSPADASGLGLRAAAWLDLVAAPAAPAAIICVGWSGLLLSHLPEIEGLRAVAWVAPPGDRRASAVECPAEIPSLLLLASQEDIAGWRVAEALFSRFNARAELRLFRRGPAGCGLLTVEPVRTGVLAWLRETLTPAAPADERVTGEDASRGISREMEGAPR